MSTVSLEKPLAGAIICCTSVAPELRTQLAEYAQEMGAEHKLDLTSDVTHLLVGDTDTLKYKYVAREREDVRVLRPTFVEAVRARWMQAQHFDIESLTNEYRLAPLHGLKICITGFEDMTFRAQFHKNVVENGGQYFGDLTKEVTHLVAARPEGKKYEYATQWQKKVVSLKWYKDTLKRGMQLDESRYHPTKPLDEQGLGAWNQQPQTQSQLGKRPRQDQPTVSPPRKLRRTASSRLSSQNDNMWTDIVGGGAFEAEIDIKPPLRPTKSMPALKVDLSLESGRHQASSAASSKYYTGKYFAISGFDMAKEKKLHEIIVSNGGTVVASASDLQSLNDSAVEARLLLVPWQTPRERVPTSTDFDIVSELWLEYCMESKAHIPPAEYPYGSLMPHEKPAGFSKLIVASSGFPGIQLMHVSKIIGALGAKYSESFNESVSVLICMPGSENTQKLKMQRAQAWGIPVVSHKWLNSCIQNNRKQPFEAYLMQRPRVTAPNNEIAGSKSARQPELNHLDRQVQPSRSDILTENNHRAVPPTMKTRPSGEMESEQPLPRSDFRADAGEPVKQHEKDGRVSLQVVHKTDAEGPLRQISPNAPTTKLSHENATNPKKPLFRSLDGSHSFTDENRLSLAAMNSKEEPVAAPSIPCVSNARTLNGEIQELLNIKATAKAKIEANSSKPKKLIGRALSNLSNASVTSHRKHSRASSVDSMNTDGVGSEIGPVSGKSQEGCGHRSFTGRAKSRLLDGVSTSLELGNPALSIEDLPQQLEEEAPALTQLVYDDPEDAIMLREKLAAKRRARSRLGQKEDDPKPEKPREPERRIKDDDILVNAGWSAGGRTRRGGKIPTPEGLDNF